MNTSRRLILWSISVIALASAPIYAQQGNGNGNQNNGVMGRVGPTGPTGATGAQGPMGPAGADGAQGPVGPAGADGAQGPVGPAGPAGANGQDGAQGPAGPQGPVGPAGANGVDGAQGPAGPAGTNGTNGTNGVDGAQGPAGPQGPQGPAGASGAGSSTIVEFSGTLLNAGDTASHTIFNMPGWRSRRLECSAVAHDVNSDTNNVGFDGSYLIVRNWDLAPKKFTLREAAGGDGGYAMSVGFAGNDVRITVTQTVGFATNGYYKMICKWFQGAPF